MTRAGLIRLALIFGAFALLEWACRYGYVSREAVIPPTTMLQGAWRALASEETRGEILWTLQNVALSLILSLIVGSAAGLLLHKAARLRRALDPLLASYYAVPTFVFYPLFIVLFGLGDVPQILIGFMLGLVAVIVNTLSGLDRVPRVLMKTARIHRLGPVATALQVSLPYAVPYIFTGVKLAVAYSFIGVIGAELIMSRTGLGYEIGYAYNNFDNAVMYPLIVFVLAVAATVNTMFFLWEKKMLARRRK